MVHVSASLFSIIISLVSFATQDIEKSFLLNNPRQLQARFSSQARLAISLPEPVSFSDQVSDQQAFFLFQDIFNRFTTLEFFPEPGVSPTFQEGSTIFVARWSFRDNIKNDRFVFRVFFLLHRERTSTTAPGRSPQRSGPRLAALWKITEIKAEKI